MSDDDMLNDTGKELADALGISQGELLGGLKSTQYNLAWMKVENATLTSDGRELDDFKRSLGRAYKGMIESLSEALEYNSIRRMENKLATIDSHDAEQLLRAVRILEQVGNEGLINGSIDSRGPPEVHVESMDEAVELGERLGQAKSLIEATEMHQELRNK